VKRSKKTFIFFRFEAKQSEKTFILFRCEAKQREKHLKRNKKSGSETKQNKKFVGSETKRKYCVLISL
jgi:hypothetical protein